MVTRIGVLKIADDIDKDGVGTAGKNVFKAFVGLARTVINFGKNVLMTAHYADPTGRGMPTSWMPGNGSRMGQQPYWQRAATSRAVSRDSASEPQQGEPRWMAVRRAREAQALRAPRQGTPETGQHEQGLGVER